LGIWAYLDEQRVQLQPRASRRGRHVEVGDVGPLPVPLESALDLLVEIEGMKVQPGRARILWKGEIANASFSVRVPDDAEGRTHVGCVLVYHNGSPLAHLFFEIEVGAADPSALVEGELRGHQRHIRSVFASYASEDRTDVLMCVRGMTIGNPQLDVFVDVMTLRSGQDWQVEILRRIRASDLFCLFWSAAASRSEWVTREWNMALDALGCEYVQPVPLVDLRDVPPPLRLADCVQFTDRWYVAHEWSRRRGT
jgi:hypothetical protein